MNAVVSLRARPAPPPPPPPPAAAPPPSAPSAPSAEAVRAELSALKVGELRQELADRGIGWADLYEKSELVGRLAEAVAAERAFCASGAVPLGRVAELPEAAVKAELADASSPVLLDVYAKWCGPCQLMAPQLDEVASQLRGRVRVVKLDTDKAPELSSALRVQGLPTVIGFRGGREVCRGEGAMMAKELLKLCEEHLL